MKMKNNLPYVNIHTHQKSEGELSITTVGVHPYDAATLHCFDIEELRTLSPEAIGEIGLDFSRPISRELQEQLFKAQLSLAEQLHLPVVIHSVRALDHTLEILKSFSLEAVIFHGFIGSEQQAERALDQGYYLSFGHRCFASPKTTKVLQKAPLSKIFFETDDYDISIEEIYLKASEHRSESLEQIKEQLYTNYTNIFKKQ